MNPPRPVPVLFEGLGPGRHEGPGPVGPPGLAKTVTPPAQEVHQVVPGTPGEGRLYAQLVVLVFFPGMRKKN